MADFCDEKRKHMKKYIGTAFWACVLIALIVLSLVFGCVKPTACQWATLKVLIIACGCSIAYCFIVGELSRNYSQMDKLWSTMPIVYAWIVAARGGMEVRLVVYAVIVTIWGLRLTFNFARKGAFKGLRFWDGVEDYRWEILRQNRILKNKFVWSLFNLFFISGYQNILVLAICLPAVAMMGSAVPFGAWDVVHIALAALFLLLEIVADEYQWKFHQKKKALLSSGKKLEDLPAPYDLGFNTTGPWAVMRHPNYLGEQGLWIALYFFACGAGIGVHGLFHWTFAGPLVLILLFMGSSELGESISSRKYPRYRDYIKQVFKYLPVRKFHR